MSTPADVMVDVAPEVTVFRAAGVWQLRAPGKTKAEVLREMEFQLRRLELKAAYLGEALMALRDG